MISLTVTHDSITPVLKRLANLGRDATPVLRSMGTTFLSITKGNFSSHGANMRPMEWKAKYDGSPARLKKSGALYQSLRLDVTPHTATVSAAPVYAAIHQFGGVIRPRQKKALRFLTPTGWVTKKEVTMPPRPFFPVTPEGQLTPAAARLIARAGERAIERTGEGRV